jgi:phospholipase/carboxylesterase
MESKQLSLIHLVQYPASYQQTSSSKYPTVLALHGRGSNERDLIGLAPYLPDELLWISPRGPFNLGFDAYEWFQMTQIGKPDPIRLAKALETLDQFIAEAVETYPVDGDNLFLLGFSQGSVIALSYTLTYPGLIRGVIAQSGYIPLESGLVFDEAGIQDKPMLLTHGKQDSVLPVDWAHRSHKVLEELNVNVEYHEFNMGHEVTADSLDVISRWLKRQLKQ